MSISVGGLISGLDTNGMIAQLLELQQKPIVKLQQQEAAYQVELTAYGSLKGVLNSMKSAAQALDAASDLTGFSTSSGDAALFTASADSSAATGTHNVTVKQLAREHIVKSAAFTGTEEILEFVGEGTIHLEIGSTFTIGSTNNKINFKEDELGANPLSAELTATITSGTYTISELETEIKTRLEAESTASGYGITYTVSYDNSTQKFTIQGANLDELKVLWKTGANGADNTGTSAASILGYSDTADDESAVSYTAANTVGTVNDISISATDTIEDVADAINDADTGVQAAVIFDGTDYFLTLSAKDSGAANVINLTVTDADDDNADTNGLSRLAYCEGGTTNLTQTQDALDSLIHVDGVTDIARSTNTIDDVIEGVTITLTDVHAVPATDYDTLTVSRNTSTAVSKIDAFVSAYNNVLDFFETYQGYDEDTEIAGSLQGDATTNQIRNSLRRLISQNLPDVGTFSRLSNLGIALNSEGHLEVNSTTLNDALDDNFDDVIQLFTQSTTGSEGFAVRMVDTLDGILNATDGTLAARTAGIQTSIDGIEDQVERIGMRNSAWEARTRAQFNALEVLLAEYQTTGDSLNQQIMSLQNLNNYISN